MFGHITRIASRPAVAAAAAAVSANAAQSSAQARAPPTQRQAAPPHVHSKIVDRDTEGWVMAELQDEVILFQPFDSKEVDEAASTVMAMWAGRSTVPTSSPIITEPGEDLSDGAASSGSSVTEGGLADAVIEAAAAAGADAMARGRRQEREQLDDLMAITTRMLRRPGMQREVVVCMLEDEEVRQLMLRQCHDLDRYLLAAGIHNPQLLPAAESADGDEAGAAAAAGGQANNGAGGCEPHRGGPQLVSRLVGALASSLERAGRALAPLGGWLRRRMAFLFGAEEAEREAAAAAAEGGQEGDAAPRPQRSGASQVLTGVLMLAVAVICVAVIRKPLVLRAMSRR